ncbi:MAG: branched-chain amino acid ABC transporter permease [Lactobacillales bacterium]|jgi:branched-chain amino acid transport system permease protein|nr:branched-chain amino acid ABC transporter permease [Lactobacillales bacterium]
MEYLLSLGILFCIYSILALSLNMVVGMSGLLSLAQAAFYGIGAYVTALCLTKTGIDFYASILLGMLVNAAIAFIVGRILSRFKGDYYAIVSAGLSIIVFSILLNWNNLTNGPLGIVGIKRPSFFGFSFSSNFSFFLFSLFFALLAYGLYIMIDRSSFARALKAIREDEMLARAMGYHTKHFKSIIFVLSAMISGVAGALFASYIAFIDPSTFQLKEGIFLFTIIIIGGLSSATGSVIGALILISLPEVLRFIGLPYETAAQIQQIIYGSMLVLIMVLRPQGLLGKYKM